MPTTSSSFTFTDGECLIFIGALGEERNVTEVVRKYFPDKESSIRSAISRDESVDDLMRSGFLEKTENEKYRVKEDRIGDFVVSLLDEPYDFQHQFRVEGEDRVKVQKLFSRDEVREIFENDSVRELLNGSYSDIKRDVSLLVKWIFLLLAVSKKLSDDEEVKEAIEDEEHERKFDTLEESVEEYIDEYEEMMSALYREEDVLSPKEYLNKVKLVVSIVSASEVGNEDFLESVPEFDVDAVNELYRSLQKFTEKSEEDIEEELGTNNP